MGKIQATASLMVYIFKSLIIILPLLHILLWIFMAQITTDAPLYGSFLSFCHEGIQTPVGYVRLETVSWTPLSKCLGFCADLIGIAPFFISLFFLKNLFLHYRAGEIFTHKNALLYRKLGIVYLMDALWIHSCSKALLIWAITMTNPPGHRYLSIAFGTPNLASLFYGTLVIVVSWVMAEASKLQEEQQFTI